MKIKQIETGSIKPYKNNSRTHSAEQIKSIIASIKEFGFTTPLLIDETNTLLAGHGRLQAAQKIGMEKVPCIAIEGLTETQKRAYIIADNQIATLSDWDLSVLKFEIEDLIDDDFDISSLAFSDDFTSVLFDDIEILGDPDAAKSKSMSAAPGSMFPISIYDISVRVKGDNEYKLITELSSKLRDKVIDDDGVFAISVISLLEKLL